MNMNPVVHFEMPAEDTKRMVDFYGKVFGWESSIMGPEYGGYVVTMTTESDKKGPKKPGAINGGFYKKTKDTAPNMSVVISVDNIKAHIEKVKKAGGKVLGTPTDIPNVGTYVSFIDTEGNRLSMLQPNPNM